VDAIVPAVTAARPAGAGRLSPVILWFVPLILLAACQPVVSTRPPATDPVSPVPTPTSELFLIVRPASPAVPAGASVMLRVASNPTDKFIRSSYSVQGSPAGVTARFLGSPAPFQNTLVLDTVGTLAPGKYTITVVASIGTAPAMSVPVTLTVTDCVEFQPGEFTRPIQSNLVGLTTAGKPSFEHGLLVPIQVCGGNGPRRIKVTLETAISEAGKVMASPPRFYMYRSQDWPAPGHIEAHRFESTNAIEREDNTGWELERDITPGLYLLVFERDRYGSSTNPDDIPAAVKYRVETTP
jgi:hypothetical protein